MYDCLRDAEFRLGGTVVMCKWEYRRVEGVTQGTSGVIKLKMRGVPASIPLSHKSLRIKNIKTGYINVGSTITYLCRKPARRYRQGLRMDNCETKQGDSVREFFRWVDTGATYSHLPEGYRIISKDFAVKGSTLYYRARQVGVCVDKTPHLSNRFKFLEAALSRAISKRG